MKKQYLLLLLLFTCSSCYFLGPSPAHRYNITSKEQPYDVAIVPGLPLKNGRWDTLLKARIIWSVYLYRKGIIKNIIFSGNAVYSPYVEGKAMAIYAAALGVDMQHIFVDTIAEHSTENLYYSYKIAKMHGFGRIALATDPFQCYLLNKFSKKRFKIKIHLLPVYYNAIADMMQLEPEVDTRAAIATGYIPLVERQGYGQRIKASRGRKLQQQRE